MTTGDQPDERRSADTWDAGDMGCGELIVLLRKRVLTLPPGAVLHLIARDRGAPEDLPAWSRLSGHRLVAADHPHYFIERKGDGS